MAFKPKGGGPFRPNPNSGAQAQNNQQRGNNNRNDQNKDEHRINERIRGVKEVRLVGDNVEMGIYSIQDALRIAEEQELDLVEISPTAVPPVCKITDFGKYLAIFSEVKTSSSTSIPTAMGKSKCVPSFFKSAGANSLACSAMDAAKPS